MIRLLQILLFSLITASANEPAFQKLQGHERWVLALAVSPDGKRLFSGSDDQTLRVWNLEKPGESKILRRFKSPVTTLAFGKKSSQIAVGTWDGHLLMCDSGTGKTLVEFPEHTETITALTFDPSGAFLASGSADDRLIIWDAKTGEELLTMSQGNEYDVSALAFSPDGETIVTGDGENQIKVWDALSGEALETLHGHCEPISALAFDANERLVSGSWDDTLRIRREGEDLILKGHQGDITALVVCGDQIISASEDKTVRIWNGENGELEKTLSGHRDSICSLAISPDGERLFSGSNRTILSWNLGDDGKAPGPLTGKVFSTELALENPKKTKDKRAGDAAVAPFSIFIPDGIETLRGVVLNPFHEATVEQEHWRTAAAHWGFALAGANLFGVRKDDLGKATLEGLQSLATASGHPELAHAPLCLVGMSAGGGMCATLTASIPDRVIASAPVCLEVGPTNDAARKIPMLTIFGERDGRQMEKLDAKFPEAREAGAHWGLAVQWGRKHEFHKANNLVMPFFDAAIRTRYPAKLSPANGPVGLLPAPAQSAWLGVKSEWGEQPATIQAATDANKLEASATCWFPDSNTAHVWQAFVTKKPKIRILDPPELGGGQKLIIHRTGENLAVKIDISKEVTLEKITLRFGDRVVAEGDGVAREFTVKNLRPGIHSLIATGYDGTGKQLLSEPHTLLVR